MTGFYPYPKSTSYLSRSLARQFAEFNPLSGLIYPRVYYEPATDVLGPIRATTTRCAVLRAAGTGLSCPFLVIL